MNIVFTSMLINIIEDSLGLGQIFELVKCLLTIRQVFELFEYKQKQFE